MANLVKLVQSQGVLHLAGIAAIATLIGTGTVSVDIGLPLLTGLVGLGVGNATANPAP